MHHQQNIISSVATVETNNSDNDEQRQELILTVNEVDGCQDFPYDDVLSLEAAVTKTDHHGGGKQPVRRTTRRESTGKKSTRSDSSCSSTILSTTTTTSSSEHKGYATRDSPRYYKEQVDPSALSHLSEMQETILLGDHRNPARQQMMYQFNYNDCPLTPQTITLTTPITPSSGPSSVMPSIHHRSPRGGMLYELCKPDDVVDDDEPLPITASPTTSYHATTDLMTPSPHVVSIVGRKASAESLPESCDTMMTSSSSPSESVMEQILGGYRVKVGPSNQLMKNLSNGTLYAIIEELQEQVGQKSKEVEEKDNELNYWKTKAEILQKKWEQLVTNGDRTTTASGRFRITPERSNSRNSNNNNNNNGGTRQLVTSQPKRRRESSSQSTNQRANKRAKTDNSSTTTTKQTDNNKDERVIDPQAVRRALRAVAESRISNKETANNRQSSPTIAPPLRHNHHFHPATTVTSQHRSASMTLPIIVAKQPPPPPQRSRAPLMATTSRSNSVSSPPVTTSFDPNNHVFEPMTSSSLQTAPPPTSMKIATPDHHDDDVDDTEIIYDILHREYNTPPLTSSSSSSSNHHDNNIYSPSPSSLTSSKWSPFSATASPLSCHHDVIMQQQPSSADPLTSNHHQELLPLAAKKSNSHPNLPLMHHHATLERKESSRSNDGRLMKALGHIMLPDDDLDDDEVRRVTSMTSQLH